MPEQVKRALIVTRLSRVTDATTSPERQRQICEQLCGQRGYEVVGIAEDLDVSGAVDPFDRKRRPNLSRWLVGEGPLPFDVIVAYRVDRLTRSIRHLQQLVNWADDSGKLVVSATEPHFDTTSPFAAVLIALIGTVAQMELEAISERNASTARHNMAAGKYRGSVPPWGYKAERVDGDWRLVQHAEQVKVIHEVVRRVLDSEPLQRIAHDLTRRGVLTPKDRHAQLRGNPIKGTAWNVTPMKRSLLSEAMLGRVTDAAGKSLRGADGSPIVRSEPILTREVFDRLGVELGSRAKRGEPTARSSSLLLRVLHCGAVRHRPDCPGDESCDCPVCGEPAYKFNGGSHSQFPRYRCKSMTKADKCGNRTIRMDEADKLIDGFVARMLGDSERLVREWDSGSDNSAELANINDELTDLTGLIGTPAYRAGTPQRAALDARIEGLAVRQEVLAAEAVRPSGWAWKSTGENFGYWWESQDTEGRNIWLRSMNVRAEFSRNGIHVDLGDLVTLTRQVNPSGRVAGWQRVFATMGDSIEGTIINADGSIDMVMRDTGEQVVGYPT